MRKHVTAGLIDALLLVSPRPYFPAAAVEDDVSWIADKRGCKVANTFPRAGESITWSGPCKDGYADGEGVMQWFLNGKEDDRYEGQISMGWAEGHGVLPKIEGGKYDGQWKHSV